MRIYNQTLASVNDITIQTYFKNPNCMVGCRFNVYVANIDDLLIGGTVNARIGETDDYDDLPKTELFKYINGGMYSD